MYEELYIIKDGERHKLDLNCPSGITLNFKSNLFGDLSKISASYSYTFKLPMTLNNRLALDTPEDIRRNSTTTRHKYKCEFWQNGVDLFSEANLYVDTTDSQNYNAVMTWGVVAGFEALKDNDLSLREIGNGVNELGRYGSIWLPTPDDFDNDTLLLHPYRGLGIYEESKGKVWCLVNYENKPVSRTNIPVVPIQYIIDRINRTYGTRFNLGNIYDGRSWDNNTHSYIPNGDSVIISRGVVPLVKTGLTDEQYAARTAILTNFQSHNYKLVLGSLEINLPFDAWDGNKYPQIISFDIQQPQNNNYFTVGSGGNVNPSINWVFYKKDSTGSKIVLVEKFKLDGHIRVVFDGWTTAESKMSIYHRIAESDNNDPTKFNITMKEVGSVTGRFVAYENVDGKTCDVIEFDFRKSQGLSPIEIEDEGSSSYYPFFFNFNRVVKRIVEGRVEITPMGKLSDDVVNKGYETDVFSNLPDISCLEFMKSLFYVMGAFPGLSRDGEIIPLRYSTIRRNISNGNTADWSEKISSAVHENPEKIAFKVSGFGQNNYFLLKNDDLDQTEPEEGEDVYEAGKMKIVCDNNSLERNKTIIQIPWFGPYLKSGKCPSLATEKDMKYQEFDPNDYKYSNCEAKPALGLIVPGAEGTYNSSYDSSGNLLSATYTPNGTYRMFMIVLNPFRDVYESDDYDYLQEIVYHPYIITESFRLDEFDLRDLDFTRPVYLEKYNAYFAIVSIQRDANGKCKCELIKLP